MNPKHEYEIQNGNQAENDTDRKQRKQKNNVSRKTTQTKNDTSIKRQ